MEKLKLTMQTWYRATFWPRRTFRSLKSHPDRLAVGFLVNLIFAVLYSITVLVYYRIGRLPAVTPWVPIPEESYYLYQAAWTIPWGLATWILISGIAYLLTPAQDGERFASFEDALLICGLAWIVPNLFLMWIPETLLVPFGISWPMWLETLRLMVFPPLWQVWLVGLGLHEMAGVSWLRGLLIGVVTVLAFFIMFLAFMR